MALTITLEIPDKIVENAQHAAEQTQRSLAEVLLAWLDRGADEPSIGEMLE